MFDCVADSFLFWFLLLSFCHYNPLASRHLVKLMPGRWNPCDFANERIAVLTVIIRLKDRTWLLLEREHWVPFVRLVIGIRAAAFSKLIGLRTMVVRFLTKWNTVHHSSKAVHVSVGRLVFLKLTLTWALALLTCTISALCKVAVHYILVILLMSMVMKTMSGLPIWRF